MNFNPLIKLLLFVPQGEDLSFFSFVFCSAATITTTTVAVIVSTATASTTTYYYYYFDLTTTTSASVAAITTTFVAVASTVTTTTTTTHYYFEIHEACKSNKHKVVQSDQSLQCTHSVVLLCPGPLTLFSCLIKHICTCAINKPWYNQAVR